MVRAGTPNASSKAFTDSIAADSRRSPADELRIVKTRLNVATTVTCYKRHFYGLGFPARNSSDSLKVTSKTGGVKRRDDFRDLRQRTVTHTYFEDGIHTACGRTIRKD